MRWQMWRKHCETSNAHNQIWECWAKLLLDEFWMNNYNAGTEFGVDEIESIFGQ